MVEDIVKAFQRVFRIIRQKYKITFVSDPKKWDKNLFDEIAKIRSLLRISGELFYDLVRYGVVQRGYISPGYPHKQGLIDHLKNLGITDAEAEKIIRLFTDFVSLLPTEGEPKKVGEKPKQEWIASRIDARRAQILQEQERKEAARREAHLIALREKLSPVEKEAFSIYDKEGKKGELCPECEERRVWIRLSSGDVVYLCRNPKCTSNSREIIKELAPQWLRGKYK